MSIHSARDFNFFKQLNEIFVAFFIPIFLVLPLGDKCSVKDENVLRRTTACLMDTVEKYRHRRSIESVRHESNLNHNERIVNILSVIE